MITHDFSNGAERAKELVIGVRGMPGEAVAVIGICEVGSEEAIASVEVTAEAAYHLYSILTQAVLAAGDANREWKAQQN